MLIITMHVWEYVQEKSVNAQHKKDKANSMSLCQPFFWVYPPYNIYNRMSHINEDMDHCQST